jgi:hypothetical protein
VVESGGETLSQLLPSLVEQPNAISTVQSPAGDVGGDAFGVSGVCGRGDSTGGGVGGGGNGGSVGGTGVGGGGDGGSAGGTGVGGGDVDDFGGSGDTESDSSSLSSHAFPFGGAASTFALAVLSIPLQTLASKV